MSTSVRHLCIIITGSCANTISESDNIYLFISSPSAVDRVRLHHLIYTRLYYADGLKMYKNIDRHKFVGERRLHWIWMVEFRGREGK